MGKMWNSFQREMGKNTGKAVSSWIFGDSHATPYRRVGGGGSSYKSQRQVKVELLESIQQKEIEHREKVLKLERRMTENEHKERLAREKRIEQERIAREEKNEQDKFDATKIQEIEVKLRIVRGLIFSDFTRAYEYLPNLTTDLDMLDWDLKCATTNKKVLALNESLCDEYFYKYCECLELSLGLLSNAQRDFHKKNLLFVEKRKASSKGLVSAAKLLTGRLFNTSSDVQKLVGLLDEKVEVFLQTASLSNTQETIDDRESKQEIPDASANDKRYSFIELNKDGRIEKQLTKIWDKYRAEIGIIVDRRPIFVSDSPENSILFVGVNPSYFDGDDDALIHSQDDRSLYYQSLYGEEEQPQYFKMLDAFTRDIDSNTPYAHMNLLYAREDNRNSLLSLDHNFIREQLELSYNTIAMLKPKVIMFFSKFCKDMIFGSGRWVDPSSHSAQTDSFILNGTTTPVIFTEDLHLLKDEEVELLEKRLKIILGIN